MILCFDLEGPLSPQDNAYEVMGLIPHGREIFEKVSRYDDILALNLREYESGYTLALILPFLIHHRITERDIKKVSTRARINEGAEELVSRLQNNHTCCIISTSYEQHAYSIGERLGVPRDRIYCTQFPLDEYLSHEIDLREAEETIRGLDDEGIEEFFTDFYADLDTEIKELIENTTVIGGRHKTEAVHTIIAKEKSTMENVTAVGDSITDFKMLREVKEEGGISIVFNGNEYAIPHAEFAYAGTSLLPLASFIEAEDKRAFIERWNGEGHFHIVNKNVEEIVAIHRKYRTQMRGAAGGLG